MELAPIAEVHPILCKDREKPSLAMDYLVNSLKTNATFSELIMAFSPRKRHLYDSGGGIHAPNTQHAAPESIRDGMSSSVVATPLTRPLSCHPLLAATGCPRLELLEEVVTLVVDEDKGGEVFYRNLPDSLHTQFGILHALNALDRTLRQYGSHTANGAEIESAVLLACVGHLLAAVALGNHYHA